MIAGEVENYNEGGPPSPKRPKRKKSPNNKQAQQPVTGVDSMNKSSHTTDGHALVNIGIVEINQQANHDSSQQ